MRVPRFPGYEANTLTALLSLGSSRSIRHRMRMSITTLEEDVQGVEVAASLIH